MSKVLPKDITSYDLLKTFAVVIMIIDHIGFYFFPEHLWWKAVGRIGFPIWFFLVGYARGRDIPFRLAAGAGILLVGNLLVGLPIFPLNALVTIALIRVLIDPVIKYATNSNIDLFICSFVLFIFVPFSHMLTEYGTQALITAMFGYFVRHYRDDEHKNLVIGYMAFALGSFVLFQQIGYQFDLSQFLFMALGTATVRGSLLYFRAESYPDLTAKVPDILTWFIQLCGRRTLEIYVIHLMIFKIAALLMADPRFGLLQFSIMNH